MSTRVTAHAFAMTWGLLRWPVYLGLLFAAVWIGARIHGGDPAGHALSAAAGALMVGATAFAFPRCPRCNHHVFGRNPDGSRRVFKPRQRCGKCNLDLTRYAPGDPRAKKE